MAAILIADDFRAEFGDGEIPTTGTLEGDVGFLADQLGAAWEQLSEGEPADVLGPDPMDALLVAAKMLALIYAELRELGFRPPKTDWYNDPMGFIERNAMFLESVRHFALNPTETIH